MKVLKIRLSDFLQIVEIYDDFMTQEKYQFDCVHLSNSGHITLDKSFEAQIRDPNERGINSLSI